LASQIYPPRVLSSAWLTADDAAPVKLANSCRDAALRTRAPPAALIQNGDAADLLAHLFPLKWEQINLTGDYHWHRDAGLRNRRLRPLRSPDQAPTLAA
jgi:hypothetical protein